MKRVFRVLAAVVLGLAAVFALLHTPPVRRLAAKYAFGLLEKRFGLAISVESLRYSLLTLRVSARGLTVRAKGRTDLPPFLEARRITVDVPLALVLKGRLIVNEIRATELRLVIHKGPDGASNVPDFGAGGGPAAPAAASAPKPSPPNRSLPEFRVDRLALAGVTVRVEAPGRAAPVTSPALLVLAEWDGAGGHAFRIESMAPGDVVLAGRTPLKPAISAAGRLIRDDVELRQVKVQAGSTVLTASGRVESLLEPRLALDVAAETDAEALRPLISGPAGLQGGAGVTAKITGPISSLRAEMRLEGRLREPVRKMEAGIEADALWDGRTLSFSALKIDTAGGTFSGTAELHPLDWEAGNRATLELHDLDLAVLASLSGKLPPLSSEVSGRIEAAWDKLSLDALTGNASLTFRRPEIPEGDARANPIWGDLRAGLDRKVVSAATTGLYAEALGLAADIRLSGNRLSGSYRLEALNLEELWARYLPAMAGSRLRCRGGEAAVSGALAGTTAAPSVTARLEARGVSFEGLGEWDIAGEASLDGALIGLRDLRLASGPAVLEASGTLALGAGRGPTSIDIAAKGLAMETLSSFLALDPPLKGGIELEGKLSGLRPSPRLDFTARLAGLEYAGARLEEVRLKGAWAGRGIDFDIAVPAPAATLRGRLGLDATLSFEASLRLPGTPLAEIVRAVKDLPEAVATGTLALEADVKGSFADLARMDISGFARIEAGEILFPDPLPAVRDIRLDISLDEEALTIRPSSVQLAEARLSIEGRVPRAFLLRPRSAAPPGPAGSAVIDIRAADLKLAALVRAFGAKLPREIAGRTKFVIRLTASAPRLEAWVVQAGLEEMDLEIVGLPFTLEAPAAARLSSGKLSLGGLTLVGGGNSIRVAGEWDLAGRGVPSVRLDGDLDLRVLQPFITGIGISGRSLFDLRADGPPGDPAIKGTVGLREVRLELAEPELFLRGLAGEIKIEPGRAVLGGLRGNLNGGPVELGGEITFEKLRLGQARLDLTADSVNLDFPENLRSVVSARLGFTSDGARHRLGGDINVLTATYRERFSVESGLFQLLKSKGRGDVLAKRDPFLEDLTFALRLETAQPVRLDNNLIEAGVEGELKLTGSPYEPGLQGRISVVDGGEVHFARYTYQIVQASAAFADPDRIVPDLNLTAQTRVAGYLIELRVLGTPDDLTATLASEPPLPESDIVALLLTGQRVEYVPSSFLPVVGLQALDYLEGVLWGQIERLAERTLGLDTVRIDTSLVAAQENPESRITVGQDISRNLEVVFSQGLREAEQQTFIVNYRPLGSLDLRAIKQDNNAFQFGAMYELRFGLAREPRPLPGLGSVSAGPVIDRVDMKGDLGLPEPSVLKRLKLRVGKRFDFFVFQKDLDRLNALYFKNGFLEADIDYRKDDVDGGAVLTYRIDAGPRVSLVTEGASVPGPVSARMRRLWKDAAFDGQRMGDVRHLLETEFFRQGHYQAKFRFVIREDAPGTRTVLVRIAPGPRYEKLIQLVEGVSEPQERLLRAVLDRPESVHLLFARPARLADDLETVLRRDGFLDAEAGEPIIDFRSEEGAADVTFPVRPGPRFVFGGVDFEGRSRLALSVVAPAAGVAPGDPFSADSLDRAEERLERLYRTNGFTDSRIDSRIVRRPGQSAVDVVFVIEENDQAVIDTVRIAGNRITADGVIARELEFGPGDFVDDRTFSAAQRRLYRLGVFRTIDVEARAIEGAAAGGAEPAPTPHDVEVRVEEIPPYYVRAGGQYDTDTGVGGTAELFRRNFLGRAIDAGSGVQAERREQSGRLYVRSPYFLGARIDTSLSGFAKRTKEADYATNRLGASFQQQVRFRAAYVLSWNYTFEHLRNLLNGLPMPGQLYDVGRITLSVTRDRRASFLNSVRGSFVALTGEYAAKFLGSDVPYLRFMGQYYIYIPVGRSLTYAVAGRLGLGKGPGRTSPTERFFAGGGSSIRGFGFHEVGPTDPVTGLPTGGDALFILNQELRFPIYKSLTGAVFVDLGNVYAAVRNFNPLRIRKTAGLGLRLDLGFAVGRLDVAFKLDRRPGESSSKIHFSLGQAF